MGVEQYMALTVKHRPVAKYIDLHFIQESITTSIWAEKKSRLNAKETILEKSKTRNIMLGSAATLFAFAIYNTMQITRFDGSRLRNALRIERHRQH